MQKEPASAIQKELKELGSSLLAQEKQAGFSVPEGYFEQLPYQVQTRITTAPSGMIWAKRLIPVRRYALAFASVLIILGISFSVYFLSNSSRQEKLLSVDELFEMSFFNTYANLDANYLFDMVLETNITADEIMFGDYLAETLIDHELIIEYFDQILDIHDIDSELLIYPDSQAAEHTF